MVKKEQTLLTAMVLGLSLLLVLRDIAGVGMSKFILLGYIVAFMAWVQYETLVYMLCFTMPLVCGLPGTYIMPCALVLLIMKKGTLDLRRIWMICAVLVMELFAALWYTEFDLISIVQYVSFAGVLIYLIYDKTELDYQQCVRMFLLGVVLLNLVIIASGIMAAPANWLRWFATGRLRFGAIHVEENSGMTLNLNPNSMAYYSIVGACCGALLTERTVGVQRWCNLLLTAFCMVAGAFSVSVTWILVSVACVSIYIVSKLHISKKSISAVAALLAVVAVVAMILNRNPEIWEGMLARLTSKDVDSGNGRLDALLLYSEDWMNNARWFFFGSGVTQYTGVIGHRTAIHNGTQQILVCCGLVGFAVYMVILIGAVIKAGKGKKLPIVYWLPLISGVLFVQSIQFLNPMMLMLPYSIGVYAIKAGKED